ncbi:hypothetical protein HRG_005140 [Hirsutella rhossiliensis]|uniref:Zn(2)-C6 fungal-type domain-containing protein n=1 Tax=Hirsutella rhossiliensis TaxID=111463 RepID=A0A9P8N0L7_9HYPO|nr:uncharacterized protein HRG_05140 [Hirsutella rhossiliensis]KAH0964712.1 hypothetical protein HRG_05140 [Hirsutella rhossiliensis]
MAGLVAPPSSFGPQAGHHQDPGDDDLAAMGMALSPASSALQILYDPYFQHRIQVSLAGQLANGHHSPPPPPPPLLPPPPPASAAPPFPHDPPQPAATPFLTTTTASAGCHRRLQAVEDQTLSPGPFSSGTADSTGPSCVTDSAHRATHATPSDHLDSIHVPGVEAEAALLDKAPPGAPPPSSVNYALYSPPSYSEWQGNMRQHIVPEYEGRWNPMGQYLERHRRAPDPPSPPSAVGRGQLYPDGRCSPESSGGPSSTAEQSSQGGAATHGCRDAADAVPLTEQGGAGPPRGQPSEFQSGPVAPDQVTNAEGGPWAASDLTILGRISIQLSAEQAPISDPRDHEDASDCPAPKAKARPARGRGRHREATESRWKKACLRCRVQKLRCVNDSQEAQAECQPCQQFSKTSKKTIHRISCFRGKLTDTVLFRRGGLELTDRWRDTAMKDVGDRVDPPVMRTIHVTSGVCGEPLVLNVVRFHARPGDVTARYWYVREGEHGHEVRKKKELDSFCLFNIWDTANYFEKYIISNALPSMARQNMPTSRIRGLPCAQQDVIKRTYAMAMDHYQSLEDEFEDTSGKKPNAEKKLLGNLFTLWFATRHTTGSAHICGEDRLDMKPELKDETYPLFGKVSLPRMIIAQFDSINHTRMLVKYGRLVLQDLESYIFRNQGRWWWTIYLCVFILLREASFISADRYRHARSNCGAKSRYSIPAFVEELQEGCNNILMHWHYYNCKPWPNPAEPWNRHTAFMADLSPEQHELVMDTLTDARVQKQLSVWKRYKEENGFADKIDAQSRDNYDSPYMGPQTQFDWDHPLYWVSQMFEEKWHPHPTYQRE